MVRRDQPAGRPDLHAGRLSVSRYRDFDAYWSEQEKVPLRFKAKGKEFTLPPSLPAAVLPRIARLEAAVEAGEMRSTQDLSLNQTEELARALFGSVLDELYDLGVDVDQVGELVMWALSEYTGQDIEALAKEQAEGADAEGEAAAPEMGASTTSSSNGPSSKPTSLASTGST